jgi:hypothetical protein
LLDTGLGDLLGGGIATGPTSGQSMDQNITDLLGGGPSTGQPMDQGLTDLLGGGPSSGPSIAGAGTSYNLDGMMGSNAGAGGGFLDSFQNSTILNQGSVAPLQLSENSELDSERF